MHMTKHVFGVYSTAPPAAPTTPLAPPDEPTVQAALDAAHPACEITAEHEGPATVAAYSVVHGREGAGDPEWGVLVCDLPDGTRAYAKALDRDTLEHAERTELVGTTVRLAPRTVPGAMGEVRANLAHPR
jgi:acetyl-CoA C-acetyltransferase